jgi:hypothetical protein
MRPIQSTQHPSSLSTTPYYLLLHPKRLCRPPNPLRHNSGSLPPNQAFLKTTKQATALPSTNRARNIGNPVSNAILESVHIARASSLLKKKFPSRGHLHSVLQYFETKMPLLKITSSIDEDTHASKSAKDSLARAIAQPCVGSRTEAKSFCSAKTLWTWSRTARRCGCRTTERLHPGRVNRFRNVPCTHKVVLGVPQNRTTAMKSSKDAESSEDAGIVRC